MTQRLPHVLFLLVLMMLVTGCNFHPTLDTSSDEKFRSSIKMLTKDLSQAEHQKFESCMAILITDGRTTNLPEGKLENLFILSVSPFMKFNDKLVALHGMTADQIIEQSKVVRAKYEFNRLTKRKDRLIEYIAHLEQKREDAAKEELRKQREAEEEKQLLAEEKEIRKQLAVVNEKITYKKKSKYWDMATYSCKIVNKGPLPISSYYIKFPAQQPTSSNHKTITYKTVNQYDLNFQQEDSFEVTFDFTYSPTSSGKIKKINMLPIEIIKATSKKYDDFKKNKHRSFSLFSSTFSQYDEKKLVNSHNELEQVETKLKKFSKHK